MILRSLFALALLLIFLNTSRAAEKVTFPPLHVVDEHGAPVSGAQATARKEEAIYSFLAPWRSSDARGVIQLDAHECRGDWPGAVTEGRYLIFLRARGRAPARFTLDLPTTQSRVQALLPTGKEHEIEFVPPPGRSLPPDLQPLVCLGPGGSSRWSELVEITWSSLNPAIESNHTSEPLRLVEVRRTGGDRFALRLPDPVSTTVRVLVHHPGFLRPWESRDIAPAEWGDAPVRVELPAPGSVHIEFKRQDTTATDKLNFRYLSAAFFQRARAVETTSTDSIGMTLSDIAPGTYSVSFRATDSAVVPVYSQLQPAYGNWPDEPLVVQSGVTTTIAETIQPLDLSLIHGSAKANIYIASATGRDLRGKSWTVSTDLSQQAYYNIPFASGVLGADSTVHLTGLRAGKSAYRLVVGDQELFTYLIPKTDDDLLSDTRMIPPARGDLAPDLDLVDVATSQPARLSNFKGKYIILDFWATWCGPCQPSMAALHAAAIRHASNWADKAVIVTVSVDDDVDTVRKHLKKTGWDTSGIHHLWLGPGKPSARGGPYGVSGIPRTVLIDRDFKILEPATGSSAAEATVDALVSQ
ncbi:MAG: TlpA family protein disulfide reductase [Candidatus Sumerlaeaceae bacterium]